MSRQVRARWRQPWGKDRDVRSGARGRGRTADTAIFSRMLYQLSYPGIPS